jgi:hypothetical protein
LLRTPTKAKAVMSDWAKSFIGPIEHTNVLCSVTIATDGPTQVRI